MTTDPHLTNRLASATLHDGWMHVCPLGEHEWVSADGKERIVQVIDDIACRMMAQHYPLSGQEALIDWEHKSLGGTQDTDAAGWGKEAQARPDGLWVRVEWSDTGRQAVEGKRYKFNSPCFPRDGLDHIAGSKYRPTRLGRIALTNNPNLRGQQPLTNSRPTLANPHPNPTHMDYKAKLLELLGLPAEATDEQIAAGVASLKVDKDKMPALNSRISELQTQLANTDLDAHGITDAGQRALFTPLLTNSATRTEALKSLVALKPATPPAPLHNRQGARVPATDKQLSNAADADQQANDLHNRAMAYKHEHKVPYETALNAVRLHPAS